MWSTNRLQSVRCSPVHCCPRSSAHAHHEQPIVIEQINVYMLEITELERWQPIDCTWLHGEICRRENNDTAVIDRHVISCAAKILASRMRQKVEAEASVTRPSPNVQFLAEAKATILVSMLGDARALAPRPYEAKILASRPNESVKAMLA